jgi:hypothetical protein
VAREPGQLHASKISSQTTSAPRIFDKFVNKRFVLFGRVNTWRDDVPELAALSSMDHFFHTAVFKLIGLLGSEIVRDDDPRDCPAEC